MLKLFLAVIEANKGIIYKIANSYGRNEDNKKDLIQEIIIQLWLLFNKYDGKYKLATRTHRTVSNVYSLRLENRRDEINQPYPMKFYLREEKTRENRKRKWISLQIYKGA